MDPSNASRHWEGYDKIEYIFVFGASTSDVGFAKDSPQPSKEQPLGVPFPGDTWSESGTANWVGHLIDRYTKSSPLVYDYAVGGHRVDGLKQQIERRFLEGPGKASSGVSWTPSNSLFITYIGGNDLGSPQVDVVTTITKLFEWQQTLYEAGARNFVIINVSGLPPPRRGDMDSFTKVIMEKREQNCQEWNEILKQFVADFVGTHTDASMFHFDNYALFRRLFADPESFGFSAGCGKAYDGEMYIDNIHYSSAVHKILAKELGSFLAGEDLGDGRPPKYSKS